MMHFASYFITSCLITIGMMLGFQLYSKVTIEIGMAALAVVFAIYSVGEAVSVMYPYLGDEEEENENQNGSEKEV